MRISDWSSDVCSSDLSKSTFSAQPSGSRACAAKSLWIVMESCYEKDGETACPGRAARVRQASCIYNSGTSSEEHTSELQSLMRIPYAVFCLTQKTHLHHNVIRRSLTQIATFMHGS